MAGKFYETGPFKKLAADWNRKLKKAGFNDAENDSGNLKEWHGSYFKPRSHNSTPIMDEAKAQYYRLAGFFLHDHAFENKAARFIWEKHSEGVSIRNITKMLKKKGFKVYKEKVNDILRTLVRKMRDRYPGDDNGS